MFWWIINDKLIAKHTSAKQKINVNYYKCNYVRG